MEFTEGELRKKVASYSRANNGRALLEVVVSFAGYVLVLGVAYYGFTTSQWLLYALGSMISALFMVKIFTLQHDCGHGSLFSVEWANRWFGRVCSLVTTMPFGAWKEEHDVHHGHVVDIDQIGHGDISLMTVEQYKQATWQTRLKYHLLRHPVFHIVFAPFFYFFIKSKFPGIHRSDMWVSVVLTNVAVVLLYGGLAYVVGIGVLLCLFIPASYLGGIIGLVLFYLQHDYPEAEWYTTDEWSHEHAALHGSSLIVLPQPLEWLTHAIGYHHIHHLNSKIPGYRLRECFESIPEMQTPKPLSWRDVIEAFKLKLWSHEKRALVAFSEAMSLSR